MIQFKLPVGIFSMPLRSQLREWGLLAWDRPRGQGPDGRDKSKNGTKVKFHYVAILWKFSLFLFQDELFHLLLL